jgi:hypothetical protein
MSVAEPEHDPRFIPPRCGARLRYLASTGPGLGGPTHRTARTARCHLNEGHPGPHRAALANPAAGEPGRLREFG